MLQIALCALFATLATESHVERAAANPEPVPAAAEAEPVAPPSGPDQALIDAAAHGDADAASRASIGGMGWARGCSGAAWTTCRRSGGRSARSAGWGRSASITGRAARCWARCTG